MQGWRFESSGAKEKSLRKATGTKRKVRPPSPPPVEEEEEEEGNGEQEVEEEGQGNGEQEAEEGEGNREEEDGEGREKGADMPDVWQRGPSKLPTADDQTFTVGENPPVYASNWEHYIAAKEWVQDSNGNPVLTSKAALVKDQIWARIQVVVDFHAKVMKIRLPKKEAAWVKIVEYWCFEEWMRQHNACRERRLKMTGQPCSQVKAYALAHIGRATSAIDYNLETPASAFSNASIRNRLETYTEVAREVHGPEYDPTNHDFEPEIVMRAGQGKKHGRFSVGDGLIDPSSAPSLSQVRARSTDSRPAIRVRPNTTQSIVQGLEERLENETRRREAVESQVKDIRAQQEAERVAANLRLAQVLQWVGETMGKTPPEALLTSPPRPCPSHLSTTPKSRLGTATNASCSSPPITRRRRSPAHACSQMGTRGELDEEILPVLPQREREREQIQMEPPPLVVLAAPPLAARPPSSWAPCLPWHGLPTPPPASACFKQRSSSSADGFGRLRADLVAYAPHASRKKRDPSGQAQLQLPHILLAQPRPGASSPPHYRFDDAPAPAASRRRQAPAARSRRGDEQPESPDLQFAWVAMGGHGGLNILPQKRWNVYNFDNREKVRNDEAAAAREEQLQREAERRRESDLRLAALRRNRGLVQEEPSSAAPPPSDGTSGGAAAEDPADALPSPASDGDHINLFSGRSGAAADFAALASANGGRGAARERDPDANPNQKNPKKRKKEEEVRAVGPDEEKYRLGYGLAGKGVAVPWYMASPAAATAKEGRAIDAGEGSRGKRSSGKKSIEELREERRKREAKEKERERAVVAAAGRKERQADRGRQPR
nr:unnamed protein product [Digitaria exilis]